ncbi:aspartyl protease family protein [candidate division WOR-3 bacterium]|nr:aspartyl protease family protein [candidate division WOR-3 bacterium]
MKRTIAGLFITLALCSAVWAQSGQAASVAAGEGVAARVIENQVYVPVTVNGQERLWLLDCGAGASVIDKGFADELGLEKTGDVQAMGAAGTVQAGFVTVPHLRVGGIEMDSQQMVALGIAPMMRRNTGTEPAGILGYTFLSQFVTKVDFAREEVTFFRPDSFAYRGPGRAIRMDVEDNIPVVDMAVDGKFRGRWRLDLGAAAAVFHHQAAEKYDLAARSGVERLAIGVGGRKRSRLVRFADAQLAGFKVKGPIISVPLEAGGGALASTSVVGTLGNTILREFTLYLDYRHNQAIFERGGNFGKELVLDRSGLQVTGREGGSFEVLCAAPNTPAEKAGFKAGDIIESVDGVSLEELGGIGRLREMLRAAPGTRYQVDVRRGDENLSLSLVLAELF